MPDITTTPLRIALDAGDSVSGLLTAGVRLDAGYVFAHGAGAGMNHRFMEDVAQGLAERGIASLRYQFAYMEKGSRRPDAPRVAHAVVRAAVDEAARRWPGLPLFAGGKSFGGRMTSQAQAAAPLPGVRGLVFFGFPLHAAGKPASERGDHLLHVECPLLFLQGTRDELAETSLLRTLVDRLGARATLELVDGADHSFHVPARSGTTDAQVRAGLLDAFVRWASQRTS
jgi:predicted alpha/beta-hydrolase family hydrolase